MRYLPILLVACAIGSCTTAPPPPNTAALTPRDQARFDQLISGKVPGTPISCLPSYYAGHMTTITNRGIAFRVGSRVYFNSMQGCQHLDDRYALVTRQYGASGMCSGDIAKLVDLPSGTFEGVCTFGEFVPYTAPGRKY